MPMPNKPHAAIISQDVSDLLTPGVIVEVSQEEAEDLGAFEETALSEEEALESIWDDYSV